jgi:CRP/FNR family transcriptional regulator, cyclic AMP receptor protein
LTGARLLVPVATRPVLLGDELLVAARRWPSPVSSLHGRMLEDPEALVWQLTICRLPRVEDRVMAVMRLLPVAWGRVTPAGIRLPLSLSTRCWAGWSECGVRR